METGVKGDGLVVKKNKIRRIVMDTTGLALIALAAGIYVLLRLSKVEEIKLWYADIQARLLEFEEMIAAIKYWWLFLLVLALLYCIKSIVPIISTSVLCIITGIVLPVYIAFPLNIAGLITVFTIRYFMGRKFGGGNAEKLIYKNSTIRSIMEHGGKGNPWLLIAFRVFPNFPVNSVSQLYGGMKFKYSNYILLSLLGFAPKLLSYTFIGRNVFDPLSGSFLIPIIVILIISGASLLFINAIFKIVGKRRLTARDMQNIETE